MGTKRSQADQSEVTNQQASLDDVRDEIGWAIGTSGDCWTPAEIAWRFIAKTIPKGY